MLPQQQEVLRLYRRLLTLHRRKLEPRMRVLGDAYVRDEFRRHKDAAPKFVPSFVREWEQYANMLSEKTESVGEDLTEADEALMNKEQKEKLSTLRDAAKSVGQSMS